MSERFESQFDRVIGGSDQEKQGGLEKYENYLNDSDNIAKKYKKYEIEKSERDVRLIGETERGVDAMVVGWGGDPKAIPVDKIHIVKQDSVALISEGKFQTAFHQGASQSLVVERNNSDISFQQSLAHESFHHKSYKSAQVYDRRRTIADHALRRRGTKLYRSGLQMIDRKNSEAQPGEEDIYFSKLEEAIVAASTHKFLDLYIRNDPRYADAFARAEKIKQWMEKISETFPDSQNAEKLKGSIAKSVKYTYAIDGDGVDELIEVLDSQQPNDYKLGFFHRRMKELYETGMIIHADRIKEIEKMDELLEEIFAKSNGEFKTKEEVFDLFAQANYSGNLLSLGKTVERLLGKGSFRRIGEDFKKTGKERNATERFKELFAL